MSPWLHGSFSLWSTDGRATPQTPSPSRSMDETFSLAEETCSSNPAIVRRKKIAISIIFSLCEKEEAQRNFQDFFFSHFPLFESHMNRLKSAIEKVLKVQYVAPQGCKGGGLSLLDRFPGARGLAAAVVDRSIGTLMPVSRCSLLWERELLPPMWAVTLSHE